jgi:hypothetical protein
MATKKEQGKVLSESVAAYDRLIATNPKIERKGVMLPYTSLNGHMFSFLSESGAMALRLPAVARQAFLVKYKTTLFESHGALMKDYVRVPGSLLKNTRELKQYLDLSYEYVRTLKPKATKKAPTRRSS